MGQTILPYLNEERKAAFTGPRSMKPEGSVGWCWQTIDLLKRRYEQRRDISAGFEEILREVEQFKVWEKIPSRKPYGSIDALLEAELGIDNDQATKEVGRREQERLEAQHKAGALDVEPLKEVTDNEPGPGRGHKTSLYNNDVLIEPQGTSQTYLIRRLKRDRPDIAEALARGEYQSARAAALDAGIVKPPSPLNELKKWWRKADPATRAAFTAWIGDSA